MSSRHPAQAAAASIVPKVTMATTASPSRLVLRLAAEADCDPRSARKALEEGAAAVRGRAGERIALAAETLGIRLPEAKSNDSEPESAA